MGTVQRNETWDRHWIEFVAAIVVNVWKRLASDLCGDKYVGFVAQTVEVACLTL
jgi:hypothetical protein